MLSINLVYRLPQLVKTFVTRDRNWALPRATARMFGRTFEHSYSNRVRYGLDGPGMESRWGGGGGNRSV